MSRPVDPRLVRRVPAVRRLVMTLAAVHLAGAALIVAQATLLADVVVTVFDGQASVHSVATRLVLLAAVVVGRSGVSALQDFAAARASVRARLDLRRQALDAIVRLGPAWAQRQPAGRLVNATGTGLDALDGYLTRALPALVSAAVVPAVVLCRLGAADWQSGVILLVLLPLVPLFMVLIGVTTNRRVERQYILAGRLAGQFLDLMTGMTTLRIYGQARAQERTLRRVSDDYRRHTLATLRVAFLSGLVLDLIAALSVAVVAVDIGLRLDGGHVSFATALLVLLLAPEVFAPLRAVGAQHHAAQEGSAAAAAALDIVEEGQPTTAPAPAGAFAGSSGRVVLDVVSVRHPGRTSAALRDVTLTLEPGSVVALTGPSGAGKSTMLSVLRRAVDAASGRVLVGTGVGIGSDIDMTGIDMTDIDMTGIDMTGIDMTDIDVDTWRESVAWLPQRPRPSQRTVADEVRLGDADADDQALARVCTECRTPALDTPLAEGGLGVSAGQRRRIALARALLRARRVRAAGHVPLVLLDEPSEDLDAALEQVVAGVVSGMAGWATVVLATHSRALAGLADVEIRMADGVVVDRITRAPRGARRAQAAAVSADALAAVPARRTDLGVHRDAVAPLPLRRSAREAHALRRLVRAGALASLGAVCGLGLTASSMWLISRAAQHPNVQALAIAVVGVRTFAIGRAVLKYAERVSAHDGALRLLGALRMQVFGALRPLSSATLGGYGRGDLLRRFVGDVDGAQDGLVRTVLPGVSAAATGLAAAGLAAALVPPAGVTLGIGLLVAGLLVPLVAFRSTGSAGQLTQAVGRRDRLSAELLESLDEVVAYGHGAASVRRIEAVDDEVLSRSLRPSLASATGTFVSGSVSGLTLAVVLGFTAQAVHAGRLPVVDVGVLAVCVLAGFDAAATLPAALVAWSRCRAGLLRVAEVVSRTPELGDPAVLRDAPSEALGLRIVDLEVAPARGAPAVLHAGGLELAHGRRVAVIGPSGCGKSTLLATALRMLPADAGRVEVTGTRSGQPSAVAVIDLCAADLPPIAAGSLQSDHVFDATLRDNLRVVRPGASDKELDRVAGQVGLLRFVQSLPSGWSTPAGSDGAALSGGQRQRLLLARALLFDPDVLVLDEPTAHLDTETAGLVLDDLLAATAGRTVLLSTHRPLPADQIDAVVAIEDGVLTGVDRADGNRAVDRVALGLSTPALRAARAYGPGIAV